MLSRAQTPAFKIEDLVYENRQHCLGSTMLIQSEDYLRMVGPATKAAEQTSKEQTSETKSAETKPTRKVKRKKRVTFRKDSELVSIREISPRPNRSDSEDNCEGADSSSDSDSSDSDSSSSDEDSDEDDDDDNVSLEDKMSKLVLKHTRDKYRKKQKAPDIPTRTIPPRPPRLRRPRPTKPITAKRVADKLPSLSQQTAKPDPARSRQQLSTTSRKFGRLLQPRRPQSCTETRDRLKQRPPSPVTVRASSATARPSLSLTSRSGDDDSINRRASSSSMYRVAPQNDRYASLDGLYNRNSGQERTKFYAWQVANGAPLVTTPGIAPMYTEQVSLMRL